MRALFTVFSKLIKTLRNYGLDETILKILERLRLISVLHTFDFVYKELDDSKDFVPSKVESVYETKGIQLECREINVMELEQLNYAEGMYSIEILRAHFGRGLRFFAAFYENVVAAVMGVHKHYAHLSYVNRPLVHLPSGIVYMNCALTAPAYRNLGIGSILRTYVLNQVHKEGYQVVIGTIFVYNRSALRWNLRNGFKRWGRVSYIKWRGRDFWWTRLTKVGRRHPHLLDHVVTETPMKEPVVEAV